MTRPRRTSARATPENALTPQNAWLGVAAWTALALVIGGCGPQAPTFSQAESTDSAGEPPNLTGVWQVLNTANWDLEAHAAEPGPVASLGTLTAVRPGAGVVVGGEIPYRAEALAQRNANRERRWTDDPELKCFMPGVPRANYLPQPFQIVQGTDTIAISYEFADAVRVVYMTDPGPAPDYSWMGWSVGHWDGNTLVVDVTFQRGDTWLDRSGNYHSEDLRVVERYTPQGPNVLIYEATLEDPKVFSRPWTVRMPLYRHVEDNAQLMEFKCIPFAEDLLYGKIGR
jgi:hypothetical protein